MSTPSDHFTDWLAVQGARIQTARPRRVYYACARLAFERSDKGPVRLSAVDIARCQERALSSERVHRFGRLPATAEEWDAQVAQITAEWKGGPSPND